MLCFSWSENKKNTVGSLAPLTGKKTQNNISTRGFYSRERKHLTPSHFHLLKEVIKKTWPPVHPRAGPRQLEAPYPLPILGMCIPPAVPRRRCSLSVSAQGDVMWCWDLECTNDWTMLRPLYTLFKILAGGFRVHLLIAQDKPGMSVPLLLKLPPTKLESSTFYFTLLCMYRGHFQFSPGELPRLWTNNQWAIQETKEVSLGKKTAARKIPGWPSTSVCTRFPRK